MDSLEKFDNLNDCCRTCLNNTSDKMYLSIFSVRDDSVSVAEMLSSCTSIKVNSNDKLPKKLCGSCYNCLIRFYDFKKLAENINSKLWNRFQECQIRNPVNASDVILRETKTEITDLGVNTYYDRVDSENCDGNVHLEPGCYLDDDKIHLPDSTSNECDMTSNYSDDNQQQIDRKSSLTTKLYTCNICSKNFKLHLEFMRHLATHEAGSSLSTKMDNHKPNFKCDICSLMFKSINSLSAHKRKHVKKDRILSCLVCKKIFKKLSHLKRHEMCHEINRPHKCSICDKSFTAETVLNDHINAHNGIKPHRCPICSKSFSYRSTLNNHIKIHMYSSKNYLCTTCGKKFDSSSNLNQHVLRHTGLKRFACSLCPRKFVSKGELKCHETTHSGHRSYICDQCGSTFTRQSALGRHKFRHTGIRPYNCDACSTNFKSKTDLQRHYRMHTGEKPYRCVNCAHTFSQKSDLIRHRRSRCEDNQYRCTQCTKTFRLKSQLHRHLSEHYISLQTAPTTVTTVQDLPKDISDIRIELPSDIIDNCDSNVQI